MALARAVEQRLQFARESKWKLFRTGDQNMPQLVAAKDEASLATAHVIFKSLSMQDYRAKMQDVEAFLQGAE